jgi:regulator of extracellular matrix RemA (YlzA/DUF370 family)
MLINVGFGNSVNKDRIIAAVSPETAPIKRLVQDAKDQNRVIDVTCGRKTRSVIITDSDHVILSALKCETVAAKISGRSIADEADGTDENGDAEE